MRFWKSEGTEFYDPPEFYDPEDPQTGDIPKTKAQQIIWDTAKQLIPTFVDQLEESVAGISQDSDEERNAAIREWARGLHLDVPGVVRMAHRELALRATPPPEEHPSDRCGQIAWAEIEIEDAGPRPYTEGREWDALFMSEADYKKRELKRFKKDLDRYVESKKRELRRHGYEKIPKKWGNLDDPDPKNPARRHFKWFVMYQIQGLSQSSIAEGERVSTDRQTVAAALKSLSRLAGIPLRPTGQ